jgi:putative transposase
MTDTFIHEIPWQTTPHHEAVLEVRLEKARHFYNGCLQESLKRLDLMRESKAYQSARTLPKGKARMAAFAASRKDHGFREYEQRRRNRKAWLPQVAKVRALQEAARAHRSMSEKTRSHQEEATRRYVH